MAYRGTKKHVEGLCMSNVCSCVETKSSLKTNKLVGAVEMDDLFMRAG